MRSRTRLAVEHVADRTTGALSASAAEVLLNDDYVVGGLVDEILASKASPEMRAHALCSLLGMLGVGSVVVGRLN